MRSHLLTASAVGAFISTGYSLQIPSYAHCPPLGPVLPAPTNPSQNAAVQAAASAVEAQFSDIMSQLLNNTYTSIRVTSIHEDAPLLDLNWKSPTPSSNSTSQVDHNTVYRIGSVSKLYVVLALLQLSDKIRWDDPVTKYIPELLDMYGSGVKSAVTVVDWEEVTIEALASQMGGSPANCTKEFWFFSIDKIH
jgi:CubicO group peptidase (beta-lactamase class C family)